MICEVYTWRLVIICYILISRCLLMVHSELWDVDLVHMTLNSQCILDCWNTRGYGFSDYEFFTSLMLSYKSLAHLLRRNSSHRMRSVSSFDQFPLRSKLNTKMLGEAASRHCIPAAEILWVYSIDFIFVRQSSKNESGVLERNPGHSIDLTASPGQNI